MKKYIRVDLCAGVVVACLSLAAFDATKAQKIVAADPPCKDCGSQTAQPKADAPDDITRGLVLPCSCPNFVIDDRGNNDPNDDYWYCDRYRDCHEDPGADVIEGDYSEQTFTCESCPGSFPKADGIKRFPGFREFKSPEYRFPLSPTVARNTSVGPVKFIQFNAEKTINTPVRIYAAVCRYSINFSGIPNAPLKDVYLGVEVARDRNRSYVKVEDGRRCVDAASNADCWSFEIPGAFPILVLSKK